MREGVRNFMVGIASIAALVALAALMMSFGELDRFTNPRYGFTIYTDNAAGLRPGGSIDFNGVPVGVVNEVTVTPDPQYPVRVHTLIDDDVRIPTNVEFFAATPLIGGSSRLQLSSPPSTPGETIQYFPTDGTATISMPLRGGIMDELTAQLDQRMKPLMESLEKFNKLADTYTAVGENINSLFQPQSDDAVANGEEPNLRTAVRKINSALDEANAGLKLAKDWLADEQLRADAKTAVANFKELTERASTTIDKYSQLALSLETDANELTRKLAPVADQLAATLEDVQRLTRTASDGKGTIGLLLNNPDLYNSLTDASIRLERTLVEVQLLLQKIQAEGLPMRLF